MCSNRCLLYCLMLIVQVVGSVGGLQGSRQAASDVRDRLQFVSQSYDPNNTHIIKNIDQFRESCLTYKVNMFTSL